jgi:hypothetical protein
VGLVLYLGRVWESTRRFSQLQETLPMVESDKISLKLQQLASVAQKHRMREEAALRGESEDNSLIEWTRTWRKTFEEHSLGYSEEGARQ